MPDASFGGFGQPVEAAGSPGLPVVTTIAPLATSNNAIAGALAANNASNNFVIAGQPDVVRNGTVTTSGAGYDGGAVTVTFLNSAGVQDTEVITPNAGAGATVAGTKLWRTVISAVKATQGASAVTVTIGYGSIVAAFQGTTQDRDEVMLYDATNLAFTAQLAPLANITLGRQQIHLKSDSTVNGVTLDANAAETIGPAGALTDILATQGEGRRLMKASSTVWAVLGAIPGVVQ